MDILLGNILGNAAIKPQDRYEEPATPLPENDAPAPSAKATTKEQSDDTWRHFSFICSKALVDKVQAIAHKEGFTIRCRASNTLIIRYEHNAGTEFGPLLETVVLLLQIADSQRYMP